MSSGGAARAQIKGMTEKDLARTWSQYVKELAVLLVAVEGRDPPAEVLERIQALVQRELLFLYIRRATPTSDLCAPSLAGLRTRVLPGARAKASGLHGAGADGPPWQVVPSRGRAFSLGVPGSMEPCAADNSWACRAALTNMSSVKKFVATAVVENVRVALGSEGPAMWRGVAAALQLTEAQRADIVTLWRAFRCACCASEAAVPDGSLCAGLHAYVYGWLHGRLVLLKVSACAPRLRLPCMQGVACITAPS